MLVGQVAVAKLKIRVSGEPDRDMVSLRMMEWVLAVVEPKLPPPQPLPWWWTLTNWVVS